MPSMFEKEVSFDVTENRVQLFYVATLNAILFIVWFASNAKFLIGPLRFTQTNQSTPEKRMQKCIATMKTVSSSLGVLQLQRTVITAGKKRSLCMRLSLTDAARRDGDSNAPGKYIIAFIDFGRKCGERKRACEVAFITL